MPGAEPLELVGGDAGILLMHGFSGSCSEIRELGVLLHAAGFSVTAPALAGHGTDPSDLLRVSRDDFFDAAEAAYHEIACRCPRVYIVGLSMGGTLGLHLAARHAVQALVTISAPVFMSRLVSLTVPVAMRLIPARNVISNYAAWRGEVVGYRSTPFSSLGIFLDVLKTVRRELPSITAPLLVLHSTGDRTVPVTNAAFIAAHVASREKEVRIYAGGRHLLTLPPHLQTVAAEIASFLRAQEARHPMRSKPESKGAQL